MILNKFYSYLRSKITGLAKNKYHPLVWIIGEPNIGDGTAIGGFSEVNAKGTVVNIGKNCDIASFVSINAADSHNKCIGISDEIDRRPIHIGDSVFIGSHSFIHGGVTIGSHTVIAAHTNVTKCNVPEYSLVYGNPMIIKPHYYKGK